MICEMEENGFSVRFCSFFVGDGGEEGFGLSTVEWKTLKGKQLLLSFPDIHSGLESWKTISNQ